LNKQQYQRLVPFLHSKSARQRVILFLLAEGVAMSKLIAMSVAGLRALKLPIPMQVYRDEMLNGHKNGPAFLYPSGNPVRETDCRRLIHDAAEKVLGRPMSQDSFRVYIQKGN
jgi:hypothetical protein